MARMLRLALASLALLALPLAGCLTNSQPAQTLSSPLPLPPLPSLHFGKAVAVDPDHRGGEPSILADHKGNYYISAPSGMVATIFNSVVDPTTALDQGALNRESFVWKSADKGKTWNLLTITPPPLPPLRGDAVIGGADTDLAVDDCNTVYYTDLWLGNVAVSHSDDQGSSWTGVPVTAAAPVDDRQWLAAGKECGTLYLLFQTFYSQLWVLKSTDKGMTFLQQTLVMDCNGTPLAATDGCYSIDGPIIHDRKTNNLYFVAGQQDSKGIWVFRSKDDGVSWTKVGIKTGDEVQLFPVIANDQDGNLYVVWDMHHNGSYNVYLTRSTDQGGHWTEPASVSGPENNGTEAFPWVAAGQAGRVEVTWYSAPNDTVDKLDDVKGDWFVTMGASDDALSATPHWTAQRVSDKPMHKGEICTLGLTCTLPQPVGTRGNRNLADFFETTIDDEGHAIVAWADDYDSSATFISHPWFGREASGLDFGKFVMGNKTA